jgi:hypothetical protein
MSTAEEVKSMREEISELIRQVAPLGPQMLSITSQTNELYRTIRGHNGDRGLLTRFEQLEDKVQIVVTQVQSVSDQMGQLPQVIDDFNQLKTQVQKNPSLLWLLRYRTKATISWLLFILSLVVLALFPIKNSGLGAVILKYLGLPIEIAPGS